MKGLLTLNELNIEKVYKIILLASKYKSGFFVSYKGKKIATLFFEDSTRTHYSFISALHNLEISAIDVNIQTSSVNKGESLYDTVKTFEAIGMDCCVIRHRDDLYFKQLENIKIPIINAGDGKSNHPTQTLLDLYTIYEEFGYFEGLKICIIGDIAHSRVAHGSVEIFKKLKMEVYISGPSEYLDDTAEVISVDEAIKQCDIIMMLRVQFERHEKTNSIDEYNDLYGLNMNRVEKMKDKAIIMHPAPINVGIEITREVVECSKSRIFKQMENGVYIRMAVISLCLEGEL